MHFIPTNSFQIRLHLTLNIAFYNSSFSATWNVERSVTYNIVICKKKNGNYFHVRVKMDVIFLQTYIELCRLLIFLEITLLGCWYWQSVFRVLALLVLLSFRCSLFIIIKGFSNLTGDSFIELMDTCSRILKN